MYRQGRENLLAAIHGGVDSSTVVIFEVFRNDEGADDKWPQRFERGSLSVLLDLQAAGKRTRLRRILTLAIRDPIGHGIRSDGYALLMSSCKNVFSL